MMVKVKGIEAPISTIYYWIHHGHLGITTKALLYPRKKKMMRRKASPDFKPMGKALDERPEIERFEDMEIDTVIQTRAKHECLLTLTYRKSRYQLIGLILDKAAISVNYALIGKEFGKTIKFTPSQRTMKQSLAACQRSSPPRIFTRPILMLHGKEVSLKIIIDGSGVGCLRGVKMRPLNRSHSSKTG